MPNEPVAGVAPQDEVPPAGGTSPAGDPVAEPARPEGSPEQPAGEDPEEAAEPAHSPKADAEPDGGDDPEIEVPEPHGHGGWGNALRELLIVGVAALVISALVRTFLVQAFWVPSGSMEETLVRNDRILAWKPATPGRGDVVVFHDPSNWLADTPPPTGLSGQIQKVLVFLGIMPSASGDDLVKRVIGVGGDTVECCSPDGRIIRNGVPIDEPYIYPGEPTDQVKFRVTVPEGRLFVMGDHRGDSADSRFHMDSDQGTVPVSSVVGRAEVIMWPPSRWSTLPNYQPAGG